MHTISLVEPSWWMYILQWWIDIQSQYLWIEKIAPICADIFVVAYPIFLVAIYLYAIIKKKTWVKQWALYIFFATFFAVMINIWIQCFFNKERPIVALNHIDAWETLLHDILPTSSFPSDHAVVSMCFAVATLMWWIYNRRKFFVYSGIFFLLISFIMTMCRILTLVHRPSDIVAWMVVWIIIPLLLMIRPIKYVLIRYIINPIIRFEQRLIDKIFHYNQWEI